MGTWCFECSKSESKTLEFNNVFKIRHFNFSTSSLLGKCRVTWSTVDHFFFTHYFTKTNRQNYMETCQGVMKLLKFITGSLIFSWEGNDWWNCLSSSTYNIAGSHKCSLLATGHFTKISSALWYNNSSSLLHGGSTSFV